MKDEIKRILKLVEDGRLSSEDASDLIESLNLAERRDDDPVAANPGPTVGDNVHSTQAGQTGSAGQSYAAGQSYGAGQSNEAGQSFGAGQSNEAGQAQSASQADASNQANSSAAGQAGTNGGDKAGPTAGKDPFKALIDVIEDFGKGASQAFDFKSLSSKFKESTKEGGKAIFDALKSAAEQGFEFGTYESREIELPLFVPEGKTLVVENQCGPIDLVGDSSDGVVEAKLKVRGGDENDRKNRAAHYVLSIEETDQEVRIVQPYVPNLQVHLSVRVSGRPNVLLKSDSSDLSAKSVGSCHLESRSGDCSAEECLGAVGLNSVSGNLLLELCEGMCSLESRSGDISLLRISGPIAIRTTSGNLVVSEFSGQTASIESVSGDIIYTEFGPVSGAVNIRTVSGDANIDLREGSDCSVALSTVSGDFTADVDAVDLQKSDKRLTCKIGNGLGTLDISTVSGDIKLSPVVHQVNA